MAASSLAYREDMTPVVLARSDTGRRDLGRRDAGRRDNDRRDQDRRERLAGLADLASADIETSLVANLSDDLHALFDPVSEGTLPIYFGPLLGRLYLEGL